jgi:16S rRNA (cytosine967-C5)-methyltransferase
MGRHESGGARGAAAALLTAVLEEGRALAPDAPELVRLENPADRARAQRLAALTLRQLARADTLLAPLLRKNPPTYVKTVLRLALTEMHAAGAAPYGAVDSAVSLLSADPRLAAYAGLANAVLRKLADAGEQWRALPPQRLPGWLRGRLLSAYGAKAVAAMEKAHEAGAALDLTAKGDAEALAERLMAALLPTGSVRLSSETQVSALPGYDEGAFWVQDAAAALPARILAPELGEAVADLCAAPGGKTLQLAAMGARVAAVDISGHRLEKLRANLARTGLKAQVVEADALTWQPEEPPRAILLDAPCSATGTIRRHPDLPFLRGSEAIKPLVALQARLIDRVLSLLPPGGRLLFATCSLLPDEGEAQIAAALTRHADIAPDPEALLVPGVAPDWRTREGGLRLRPDFWPDLGGIDGFYIALLRKR